MIISLDWADGARGGAAVRIVGVLSLPDVLGGHLLGALLNHGHDLMMMITVSYIRTSGKHPNTIPSSITLSTQAA